MSSHDNPTPPPAAAPAGSAGQPVLPGPPATAAPAHPSRPERLELRAALLVGLLILLLAAATFYVLYARGVFEATQRLVLVADDSEGVVVGMDLSFSGFAIGRVRRVELAADGSARILIDVPRRDAHWLRQSSVFTLTRGLVGNTSLRAYSGMLTDLALGDGAERRVLAGDASAEVPRLVAAARELVANLSALTAPEAALAGTLAGLQSLTTKMNGPGGAIGVLTGKPGDATKLPALLDRAMALLARVDSAVARVDGLVGHADAQVFGAQGLATEVQAAVRQLQGLLGQARSSLKQVDGLLDEALGAARNVRGATTDLEALRAEVETSLRKVDHLVDELNRKWPFARDKEIKLP